MSFPASKKMDPNPTPPPPPKVYERNWTCGDEELNGGVNQCDAVLKTRFVGIRTDPKNPNKFVPVCEKCGGLIPKNKIPVPVDWRFVFAVGFLTPIVIRLLLYWRGWW